MEGESGEQVGGELESVVTTSIRLLFDRHSNTIPTELCDCIERCTTIN